MRLLDRERSEAGPSNADFHEGAEEKDELDDADVDDTTAVLDGPGHGAGSPLNGRWQFARPEAAPARAAVRLRAAAGAAGSKG